MSGSAARKALLARMPWQTPIRAVAPSWLETYRRLKVNFLPTRLPQFTGADKDMWGERQRQPCGDVAGIAVDCPEQFNGLLRFKDRGVMLDLWGCKRPAQIACRIVRQPGGGHSIAQHAARKLQGPPGALQIAFGFDPTHCCENIGLHYGCDRHVADHRIELAHELIVADNSGFGPRPVTITLPLAENTPARWRRRCFPCPQGTGPCRAAFPSPDRRQPQSARAHCLSPYGRQPGSIRDSFQWPAAFPCQRSGI